MKNIFKSTYRNSLRNPATDLINHPGLALSLALGIALLTVSRKSWKAAIKDPVEAL